MRFCVISLRTKQVAVYFRCTGTVIQNSRMVYSLCRCPHIEMHIAGSSLKFLCDAW